MSRGFGPIFQPANIITQLQPRVNVQTANPISAQWYPVLAETRNCRLWGIESKVTWATTQPTPLEVRVTVDGNIIIWFMDNPVSGTGYNCSYIYVTSAYATMPISAAGLGIREGSYLLEGKLVSVDHRITWATTQPTPLETSLVYSVL